MTYQIYFTADPIGLYRTDINGERGAPGCSIPASAQEITPERYEELLSGQQAGMTIAADDQGLPVLIAVAVPSLDEVKAMAMVKIDRAAGIAREALAAPGAFQDEEYRLAAEQAELHLAGVEGTYPALEADIAAQTIDPRTGEPVASLTQAAELIMFTRAQWLQALDAIRHVRLCAKSAVRLAVDVVGVQSALAGINWPPSPA